MTPPKITSPRHILCALVAWLVFLGGVMFTSAPWPVCVVTGLAIFIFLEGVSK